jgi:carboxylesterase
MKKILPAGLLFTGALLVGCGITPIEYDDTNLDGEVYKDTSLTDPTFLLSGHPELDTFNREKPVIIGVHGYTATTFEWVEFRDYAHDDNRAYTSLVLMGGHGLSIDDFDGSTWEEWQRPIMEEYDALVDAGFSHISIAGASTGGAVLLEYLGNSAFDDKEIKPEEFYFIDAIVVPASKLLHIVPIVGPILGNSPNDLQNDIQKRHWYLNRPASTLSELNEIIERVRKQLEEGVVLPEGSRAKCYKSEYDETVDPVSSLLMYKGMREYDNGHIDVEIVESKLHVFTQLAARVDVTEKDIALQQRVFEDMIDRAVNH